MLPYAAASLDECRWIGSVADHSRYPDLLVKGWVAAAEDSHYFDTSPETAADVHQSVAAGIGAPLAAADCASAVEPVAAAAAAPQPAHQH